MRSELFHWLGIQRPLSHMERGVAALGALAGIFATYWISRQFLGADASLLMVASMGAGAVLLFAVPHATLSQPWPAFVGHLVAALIGVSVAKLVPDMLIAAPLSVSLAVLGMHYSRSIHPPGGATALIAVIGGPDIHAMGFAFVPLVLLNAISLLLVAFVFNFPFPWRRYPMALVAGPESRGKTDITEADLQAAIQELDLTVDITEGELLQIYRHARHQAGQSRK